MATSYDIGNKIRITGTFTDPLDSDAAVDPSSVYCSVKTPAEVKTDYQYGVDAEITKSGTGVYYLDLPLDEDGYWYVRWWGKDAEGVVSVAEEVQIKCVPHEAD